MKRIILILAAAFLLTVSASYADTDSDFTKGLSSYKKGDFRSAIKYLKVYADKASDARAYYLMGYASYKLRDYEAARKYFTDAYSLDPNFKPEAIDIK